MTRIPQCITIKVKFYRHPKGIEASELLNILNVLAVPLEDLGITS